MAQIKTAHDTIPDFCADETNSTVRDGSWSDPNIWSAGRVPIPADIGCVLNKVQVDVPVIDVDSYCIDRSGALNFPTGSSTLFRFNNFMMMGGNSALTCPGLQADKTLRFVIKDKAIDTVKDPLQWGQSFIAMAGNVQLHGAAPDKMFIRLAKAPKAGDTALVLAEAATGWRANAKLFLADSVNDKYVASTYKGETCALASVSADGLTLQLSAPLKFDHPGSRDKAGKTEFLPYVMYLTSNITFESENPLGTRGHTAFMQRTGVDLKGVGFIELGRTKALVNLDSTTFNTDGTIKHLGTNQIGRYSFHLHHLRGPLGLDAATPQWHATHIVIDGSPKIGQTVHDSHYGLLEESCIYNCAGAGIFHEQGNEWRNVTRRVAIAACFGSDGAPYSRQFLKPDADFAHEGSGIWVRGPGMGLFDQVVCSNFTRDGVILANLDFVGLQRVPAWKGADPDIEGEYNLVDPVTTASYGVSNIEAYGAMDSAFSVWNVGQSLSAHGEVDESVYSNIVEWNVRDGVFLRGNHITLDGFISRGMWSGKTGRGIANIAGRVTRNTKVLNYDIQGKAIGIDMPTITDFPMNLGGGSALPFQIGQGYLCNVVNISILPPTNTGTGGDFDASQYAPKHIEISNPRFDPWAGSALKTGTVTGNIVLGWPDLTAQQTAANVIVSDTIKVTSYNGVVGDDFNVMYPQQAPDFVLPQTVGPVGIYPIKLQGCPEAGLTNAQAWAKYGISAAGSVSPSSTTRAGVVGFVSAIQEEDPVAIAALQQQVADLQAQVSSLQGKLTQLQTDLAAETDTSAALQVKSDKDDATIADLNARIAKASTDAATTVADLAAPG
jgi:hypothetical protein